MNKMLYANLFKIPTVRIRVKGGIAEVVSKDRGFRVIIEDHDGVQNGEGIKRGLLNTYDKVGKGK